jgi:sialic acid synthase SpsE
MEPEEFQTLVREGISAHEALGKSEWSMQASEKESRRLRRSLFISADVQQGEEVNFSNVRAIRPGYGLDAKFYNEIQGRIFKGVFKKGTPLTLEHFQD